MDFSPRAPLSLFDLTEHKTSLGFVAQRSAWMLQIQEVLGSILAVNNPCFYPQELAILLVQLNVSVKTFQV